MCFLFFFFFNDTATTEIYTLSLHDALPISVLDPVIPELRSQITTLETRLKATQDELLAMAQKVGATESEVIVLQVQTAELRRSEEHTSELQSRQYLVCRLLLEKKKKQ